MVTMLVCGGAVLLGLAAAWRWGGVDARRPDEAGGPLSRYAWNLNAAVGAGLASGLLVLGPGGRLAMRLLAATAGDAAQGLETEAHETVGRISASGTLVLILFVGVLGGLASGAMYVLIRRWLPPGRLGGLAFGALLLVVFASRLDPLRKDNPDFDLVGPGWLALIVFGALVLAHGMTVAAVAARLRSTLPLFKPKVRVAARYLPLVVLVPLPPLAVFAVVGGLVAWVVGRSEPVLTRLQSRGVLVGGRVVLAVAAAVALPGFVIAAADIAGRGP